MKKRLKQKKRGCVSRNRANIVLIGAEGKNKTERIYFSDRLKTYSNFRVNFAPGDETDPVGIVNATVKYINKNELQLNEGDIAFCFIDTDTDKTKQAQINEAKRIAAANEIQIILSNPCFEVWFLQHYRFSTKCYISSNAVVNELRQEIPNYEKNMSIYNLIAGKEDAAIENAIRLEKHHKDTGCSNEKMDWNPSTDVYKVLLYIKENTK